MTFLYAIYQSPEFSMLVKMMLSIVAGAVIGLERHQNGNPAGVRTFSIISLTSTILTASLTQGMYGQLMGQGDVGASRIIQGILQGIGFIGAGVIVRDGVSIKGLTSAASIWAVAGIGVLIGSSEFFLAVCGTLFTALILVSFGKIDALTSRRSFAIIEATFVTGSVPGEQQIQDRFTGYGFNVSSISFKGAKSGSMQIKVYVWTLGNAVTARSKLAMELLNDRSIADFSVEPVRE